MKYLSVVCALCVLVALTNGAPMPQNDQDNGVDTRAQTTQIVNGINNKIKLLRQYCPQLFQVIDNVIQNVTSTAFRVIGRVVLQSGALGIGGGGGGGGGSSSGGSRVSVVLPTFGPDDDDYDDEEEESNNLVASSSTTESPASETRSKRETAERTIRAAEDAKASDQESAASGGNALNPSDDLSNVEADDADRDKRFLPFGGSFGASASAGGSAGGSGNFLFDIIRLVAGSGATEESDEKDNAPAGPGGVVEIDVAKGSTEGIPGPITRLFVLANRGIANLIQDLILRIASTSERIVNFKARLITALI